MIYLKGSLTPTKKQKSLVVKGSDDSFCSPIHPDLYLDPIPQFDDMGIYTHSRRSGIALKINEVLPHTDTYNGDWNYYKERLSPKYVAMFWLLKGSLEFFVGEEAYVMREDDFVFFNDAKQHCALQKIKHGKRKLFYGVAIQYKQNRSPILNMGF